MTTLLLVEDDALIAKNLQLLLQNLLLFSQFHNGGGHLGHKLVHLVRLISHPNGFIKF